MSRIVFLLEEPSAKALIETLVPRLFPTLELICITHEGKSDLEKSLPRKLKAWTRSGDRFVVLRDNDGANCVAVKAALSNICSAAGRGDSLVRIACQELEAWYFGDTKALALALEDNSLADVSRRSRYRDPDAIQKPSRALAELCPGFQKVGGARKMGAHLSYVRNNSASFRAFVEGVSGISGAPIEG
jgi:hypothetical protein